MSIHERLEACQFFLSDLTEELQEAHEKIDYLKVKNEELRGELRSAYTEIDYLRGKVLAAATKKPTKPTYPIGECVWHRGEPACVLTEAVDGYVGISKGVRFQFHVVRLNELTIRED